MRKLRFKEIQRILSDENITSQESLLIKLKEAGINITQATLSRDLAYLQVGKVFIPNIGYVYVMPHDKTKHIAISVDISNIYGVISVKFSRNIAVIRTLPGYAVQICVHIDKAEIPEIIGTVAGDDTIMIVIDELVSQDQFKEIFFENFPNLKNI